MIITERFLDSGKSVRGGWNKRQMSALGVENFNKGWRRALIGKEISDDLAKQFIELKDAHIDPNRLKAKERRKTSFEPVDPNTPYADQYKHPNWQKMRLIVLKRDGFRCVNCKNGQKTLHAHHLKYNRKGFIWEVPHWYIVTLCEDCHSEEHGRDLRIK